MLEQSVGTDLRSSFNEQLQHLGVQSSAEDPEEVQKGDTANTQQSLGEAEILHCLSYPAVCRSIGHDLKTLDKGRDAIRQVYFNAVANTAPRNKQDTGRVPTLFANLAALEDCDEAWKVLRNGTRKFQSFISFAPITGLHSERYGQKNGNSPAGRKEQSRSATSPVVCFVSRPHEGQGTVCTARHTAICTGPDKIGAERYVIPALALFTVVSDTDEADACLPGNQIRQRVIVLQFTYKLPTAKQMKQIKSTRSDYRKQLEDLIGPKPTEPWSVQYDACLKEGCEFSKGFSCPEKAYQLQDKNRAKVVPRIMNAGFTKEESEMFFLLSNPAVCRAMGNALRQPRSDYAAITHSFYNLIATKALALQRADDPKRIAPALYKDLQALEERDPEWHNIFTKDAHGFQGFTSYSPVTGLFTPSPDSYDPNGIAYDDGKIVVDAPVVRFVSSPYDPRSSTLHSAVCTSIHERNGKQQYTLPPLTLFKVVEDTPAPFEYLPGKFMNQRLITVQLTYTVPPSLVKEEESPDEPSSRFLSKVADLRYGGLNDAGGGISGLLEDPVLTMEEEFGRNDQWVDWNGHNFWGLKEWEYVTGPAKEGEAGVDAIGDKGHDGWLPEDFLRCINGTLEDEQLHLDMDEVLAVRLYTGAPYQVINQFLRAISNVQGIWRKELVANPKVTYAATARNLYFALQKLCSKTQVHQKVYRGVRGALPRSFWCADCAHKICAVDFGFMSTSTDISVSLAYLGHAAVAVLWEIDCMPEDDVGFHSPADVSGLSQYPDESELLFPPLTMLEFSVDQRFGPLTPSDLDSTAHASLERRGLETSTTSDASEVAFELLPSTLKDKAAAWRTQKGARYVHIKVKATFT